MMKAIRAALDPSRRSRITCASSCFMTDGYVGNDMEIIGEVQEASERARLLASASATRSIASCSTRWPKPAAARSEYVALDDDGRAAARALPRAHPHARSDRHLDRLEWHAGRRDVSRKRCPTCSPRSRSS